MSSGNCSRFELSQIVADRAFEPAAHADRIRFRNIGEAKQQSTLASISDHPRRESIDGEPGRLGFTRQVGIANPVAQEGDKMHAAGL